MLFISHDLNVIQYIADWVAVMYAGHVMEVGPVQQVFKSSPSLHQGAPCRVD